MTDPILQKVIPTNIVDVMQTAYIDYSMSVIISRALPDVRDGLKPVHRRILYAMLREGLVHNRPFDKCAGVVGEVLKNYHPHGDSSVYDSLVRMAQDWVMRYPLINPQGNFGSIDGDPAAAYRYTECRLSDIAEKLLKDIDEDTVNFVPNYKESTFEPHVLPAALPNLLMNGAMGIAVGMTTNIPPHNLSELIEAICKIIDNPSTSVDEIAEIIRGPDFPTGGVILGREGILKYLRTGRGIIRVRGVVEMETQPNGREHIIIKEIPFNVNRAELVLRMAELVSEKTFTEISDIRDESDENTRIVIELKRGEMSRVVVNKLFKLTNLENSFGVILLALDKQRPKQMNIKEMLECYIEHRREVIYRRTQFLLRQAEARAHVLEGYKIALDHLDEVVRLIRASKNREEAKAQLKASYPLSDIQVNAILDLRLYQLTGMERGKIDDEYAGLLQEITGFKVILSQESRLLGVVKEELLALKGQYASERKTIIFANAQQEFSEEDMIPNVGCMVTVTHDGFIKRTEINLYRQQKRGGKGVIATGQHEEDFVEHLFTASTHDCVMFVMNNGRVYVEKVYEIPDGSRTAKGRSIANVLQLQAEEKVSAMLCFKTFEQGISLVICTKNGVIKKTAMREYVNCRAGGLNGTVLDEGDEIISAALTYGNNDVMLFSYKGMAIRFHESDLRDQGRVTRGVKGMALRTNDCVKGMVVVDPEKTLLIAGIKGHGKRTHFDEFKAQKRGGIGVTAIRTPGVTGALSIQDVDEIMLLTQSGQSIRVPVNQIRIIGRSTSGVRLIRLDANDKLIGMCKVVETEAEAV